MPSPEYGTPEHSPSPPLRGGEGRGEVGRVTGNDRSVRASNRRERVMPGKTKKKKNRPRLLDRIGLWLSTSRSIDGLWIGAFLEDQADRILDRVEEALRLIKTHDPLRYNRLIRDLDRVWVRILPEATASYLRSLRACQLNTEFVRPRIRFRR